MTDTGTSTDLVSAVTYGPAGELLTMTGSSVGETRTYNSMGQLTQLTGLNGVSLKYNYTAGANNGQIASQQDLVSGETITYAYDSLKRLSAATSTASWGQAFTYDGFGNLTAKTALSGTPPVRTYAADPATNRLVGIPYDANGNERWYADTSNALIHDVSNRMVNSQATSLQGFYEYDPSNKRVYQQRQHYSGSAWVVDATEFYFYGATGRRLGTYWATVTGFGAGGAISWSLNSTQVFFKGKLVQYGSTVQEDIRASIGSYYPYGEDKGAYNPPNDSVKFASYARDSATGLDYALSRYYLKGTSRFGSPDRNRKSAKPQRPSTWNSYAYVNADPVNANDRTGREDCLIDIGEDDCEPIPSIICNIGFVWDPLSETCVPTTDNTPNNNPDDDDDDEDLYDQFDTTTSSLGANISSVIGWLSQGAGILQSFTTTDPKCLKTLSDIGLTVNDIQSAAKSVTFSDGLNSSAGLAIRRQMIAHNADFSSAQGHYYVYYYSDLFWQTSLGDVLGTMVHEFVHVKKGTTDATLESNLKTVPPSRNVSEILKEDCFRKYY